MNSLTPSSGSDDGVAAQGRRETLYPVEGCGRCADLVAAHLLGSDLYDAMADHLADHKPEPSIWPDVNEAASRVCCRG